MILRFRAYFIILSSCILFVSDTSYAVFGAISLEVAIRMGRHNIGWREPTAWERRHRGAVPAPTVVDEILHSRTDWANMLERLSGSEILDRVNRGQADRVVALFTCLARHSDQPDAWEKLLALSASVGNAYAHDRSGRVARLLEGLIQRGAPRILQALSLDTFSKPELAQAPRLMELLIDRANHLTLFNIAKALGQNEEWAQHPEIARRLLARAPGIVYQLIWSLSGQRNPILRNDFVNSSAFTHPIYRLQTSVSRQNSSETPIRTYSYEGPRWSDQYEFILELINTVSNSHLANFAPLLGQPAWAPRYPQLVRRMIERAEGDTLRSIVDWTFNGNTWLGHPDLLELLIERGDGQLHERIIEQVLSRPEWQLEGPLRALIRYGNPSALRLMRSHQSYSSFWAKHPELLSELTRRIDQASNCSAISALRELAR